MDFLRQLKPDSSAPVVGRSDLYSGYIPHHIIRPQFSNGCKTTRILESRTNDQQRTPVFFILFKLRLPRTIPAMERGRHKLHVETVLVAYNNNVQDLGDARELYTIITRRKVGVVVEDLEPVRKASDGVPVQLESSILVTSVTQRSSKIPAV